MVIVFIPEMKPAKVESLKSKVELGEMECYRFHTGNEIIELPLVADVKKIYVEVTTACKYSCITCIRHSWSAGDRHMSAAIFEELLSNLADLPQLKTVHFGGFGEPLSHPNILDMIGACKQAGYQVEMITNGSFLTPEVARKLVELELDWLFVSLDGPDDESFSEIRPGASFEEVTCHIKCLQEIKQTAGTKLPRLGVEFVATKQNYLRLPAMRRIVDELRADRFVLTNVLPYHASMKDEILYDEGLDFTQFGGEGVLLSLKAAPQMQVRSQRNCKFVDDKAVVVTAAGEISPCYALMHNYTCYILGREKKMTSHSFGNLHDRSLRDIWTDPKYAYFRWIVRSNHYPSCTDCKQIDGCAMAQTNESDCWGNQPSCGDCLWARDIVVCP